MASFAFSVGDFLVQLNFFNIPLMAVLMGLGHLCTLKAIYRGFVLPAFVPGLAINLIAASMAFPIER